MSRLGNNGEHETFKFFGNQLKRYFIYKAVDMSNKSAFVWGLETLIVIMLKSRVHNAI